jgi:hypothetical protein
VRLVFGQDDQVAKWVSENIGIVMVPPYVAIGGTRDGRTLCIGVVFNDYNKSNVEISLYGPGALTRGNISAIYQYAFNQLGVNRVTAKTRRTNKRMQKLLPKFGFKYEGTSARYFGPSKADDAIRFVLFPEEAEKRIRHYGRLS